MLEDSVSSTWESMANWFTPTVLFLFLNLMIATIAFTSSLSNNKSAKNVSGSTNLSILNPLKSTTFHTQKNPNSDAFYDGIESHAHYLFQHNTTSTTTHNTQTDPQIQENQHPTNSSGNDDGDADFDENNPACIDKIYNQITVNQSNSRSDEPEQGIIPLKLKKSASLKLDFGHSDEEDIVEKRRPMTLREKGSSRGAEVIDDEVDARASDFINKFKHQLKLQRLDSILKAGTKM